MSAILVLTLVAAVTQAQPPKPAAAQQPAAQTPAAERPAAQDALQVQVMLDRAGFSPGAIDGRMGANTRKALALYQKQHGGQAAAGTEPLTTYRITAEDANGPYVPSIPSDLVAQAKLPALAYKSPLEAIAERFHSTPEFIQKLNPGAKFVDGEEIKVPNVEPLIPPVETPPQSAEARKQDAAEKEKAKATGTSGRTGAAATAPAAPRKPDVVVTVSKAQSALTVKDEAGKVIFYAPVTTGSERDPLPIGEWKVNGVQMNPKFHYNPDLFWDADPSHSKATVPAGPNNPVGLVWIDITKEHYGIHGTPEPATIGKTESHGCVRLTNWDALKLASLVQPGTKVIFTN